MGRFQDDPIHVYVRVTSLTLGRDLDGRILIRHCASSGSRPIRQLICEDWADLTMVKNNGHPTLPVFFFLHKCFHAANLGLDMV